MSYCRNCGEELLDGTQFCPHCGAKVEPISESETPFENLEQNTSFAESTTNVTSQTTSDTRSSGVKTALVFLIISCVFCVVEALLDAILVSYSSAIFDLISLCWLIPVTLFVSKKQSANQISTGAKVCILLFCNTISGIILLCSDKD